MGKRKRKRASVWDIPETSEEILVTLRLLKKVENAIESRIESQSWKREQWDARFDAIDKRFEQVDVRFNAIDKRFEQVDARFDEIDKRFEQVNARFNEMDKKFEQLEAKLESAVADVRSDIARALVLAEEQRAENRIVLEGYGILRDKFVETERRLLRLESR